MENHFVNSAVIGLSNGEIVRFTSLKTIQCNKKDPLSFVCKQSSGP